ncbi:MAG TPA: histidine kinase [Dermatophilaceae bacterium]|nr:histidine kinase [Dermatophilaceae bacterium]
MIALWRSLWREPRAAYPPPVGRVDRLLVAGFEAAALVEGIARPGMQRQPWITLLAMAVIPALLWRRRHPLRACLAGFGVAGLMSAIQLATRRDDLGPSAMLVVIVLLYALLRWGSGREIAVGMPCVVAVVALGMAAGAAGPPDVVGGALFLLLVVALAVVVRYRADLGHRRHREIRNEERLALARELHDTVAHHVSAIAVQAQAGRVVAGARPERAVEILAAVEAEATHTLAEMRAMVRVLRTDDADAAYAPRFGVADLPALARTVRRPTVEVRLDDSVSAVPRQVDAALYRIAQEAITNAVRHARGASVVQIEVCRVGDTVRLRVLDDGTGPSSSDVRGFGLTGMAERAQLLGGELSAGPSPQGGWLVQAVMPAGGAP